MSHPFTDIVIPVRNALSEVEECLTTLQANTQDYRLILVDDASERNVHDWLVDFSMKNPSSILVKTSRQRWFTRASNLGLRLLRTERSVLLNSDVVLGPGWLDELFDVWSDYQAQAPQTRIGLVGSTLSAEEPRRYADVREPGYVTGHCWLVSVSALFDISAARGMPGIYLDEVHRGAAHIHSDRIACNEMNKLGMATLASFKAAVGHKGGRSWNYDIGAVSGIRDVDLDMNR